MTAVDGIAQSDDLTMDVLLNMLSGDEGGVLGALSTVEDSFAGDSEAIGRRQIAAILLRRRVEQDPTCVTPEVRKGVIAGFLISPNVMAEHLSCLIQSILQTDSTWPQLLSLITGHSVKQPLKFIKLIEICATELIQFLKSDCGLGVVQMILEYASASSCPDSTTIFIDTIPRSIDVRIGALKALRAFLTGIANLEDLSRRWLPNPAIVCDEDASGDEEEESDDQEDSTWACDASSVTIDILQRAQSCVLRGLEEVVMRDLQLLTMGSELLKCQNAIWRTYASIGVWSNAHMEEVLMITLSQLNDYYTIYSRMVIDSEEDDLCLQDNAPVLYIIDMIRTLAEFQCAAIYMKLHQIFYILMLYSQLTNKQCCDFDPEELGLLDDPYISEQVDIEVAEIRPATLALMQQYLRSDSKECRGRLSAWQAAIESLGHLARDHADRWKVEECVLFFAGALREDFFTVHVLHSAGAVLANEKMINPESPHGRNSQRNSMSAGAIQKTHRFLLVARSMSILALHASQVVRLFVQDLVELVSRVTSILMTVPDIRVKAAAVHCLLQLCDSGCDKVLEIIDNDGILMHCERLLSEGETDLYRRLCVKALMTVHGSIAFKKRLVSALLASGVNHQIQLADYILKMHADEEIFIGRDIIWVSIIDLFSREWRLADNREASIHLAGNNLTVTGTMTAAHLSVALSCLRSLLERNIMGCQELRSDALFVINSPDFVEGECMGCEDISRLTLKCLLAVPDSWQDLHAPIRLIACIAQLWLSAQQRRAEIEPGEDATLILIFRGLSAVISGVTDRGLKGDLPGLFACLSDIVCEKLICVSHRRATLRALLQGLERFSCVGRQDLLRNIRMAACGNETVKQRLDAAILELLDNEAN